MNLRAEDYLHVLHDNRRHRELRCVLRSRPEPERLVFVLRMMDFSPRLGWELTNTCLRRRELIEQVFLQSFPVVGAGTNEMGQLLRAIVPRLGIPRVVRILFAALETYPEAVDKALYFLPRYVSQRSRRDRDSLRQICAAADAKGINRRPVRILFPPKP